MIETGAASSTDLVCLAVRSRDKGATLPLLPLAGVADDSPSQLTTAFNSRRGQLRCIDDDDDKRSGDIDIWELQHSLHQPSQLDKYDLDDPTALLQSTKRLRNDLNARDPLQNPGEKASKRCKISAFDRPSSPSMAPEEDERLVHAIAQYELDERTQKAPMPRTVNTVVRQPPSPMFA